MSGCRAVVVALEGQDAIVEMAARASACGACPNPGMCGITTPGNNVRRVRLANPHGARLGETVEIEATQGTVWQAAFLAYVLPLALALAGATLGHVATGQDGGAIAGLLAGLALGLLFLKRGEAAARRAGEGLRLRSLAGANGENSEFNVQQESS